MDEGPQDYETIIQQIRAGLTRDPRNNYIWLKEQMEVYRDHPMAKRIRQACCKMVNPYITYNQMDDLDRAFQMEASRMNASLDEVLRLIQQKKPGRAWMLLGDSIRSTEAMERSGAYQDDADNEYHDFQEPFEEILYRSRSTTKKALRATDFPFMKVRFLHGYLLLDLKRPEEARDALEKGLRWNPVSFPLQRERMEAVKRCGDMDRLFSLTKDAFRIAFRPADVARCFKNLGYFFVEKKLYEEAAACFVMALQYEEGSRQAMSELRHINKVTRGKLKATNLDTVRQVAEEYGFPAGADPTVIRLAVSMGSKCASVKDYNGARYYFTIAFRLTNSDFLRKQIEQLPAPGTV